MAESVSTPKKLKKAKVKSVKIQSYDEESSGDLIIDDVPNVACTLKKSALLIKNSPSTSSTTNSNSSMGNVNTNNKKRKKRDSATSSDEERWLTAIESGKLEDVDDELKKIKTKDPSLMTARQRAMYDRGVDGSPSGSGPALMSLPSGYKEKVMTAEAIQKAAIKSQKRKQLADEKREKDKKKTMERLLKKQEAKTKTSRPKTTRSLVPMAIYVQNVNRTTVTFPERYDFPLKAQKRKSPPPAKYCSCGNLKKYTCSRTGQDVCSFSCYKLNISRRIL